MVSVEALHRAALEHTRAYVEGLGPEHWSQPTPCEGWDVRELVNHIVAGNWWAAELADGATIAEVGDRLDGDTLGEDPLKSYEASAQAAASAFEEPGALERPCAVSYGPVPGSVYAGHRFLDVLIHGWDLAKATGQSTTLPPDLISGAREVLDPQLDMLRASGEFGDDLSGGSADPQAALLGLVGRRP